MTPEQDKAMMAVLKAIAEARRAGLSEQLITDRIHRTKPDETLSADIKALAGLDSTGNSNLPDESHPRTDLVASRVLSGEDLTEESTPLSALDIVPGKGKKKNKKSKHSKKSKESR
jgi:hypothetical protein